MPFVLFDNYDFCVCVCVVLAPQTDFKLVKGQYNNYLKAQINIFSLQ